MKLESLQKGNAIRKEIAELQEHFNHVFKPSDRKEYNQDPYSFEISKDTPSMIPNFHVTPFFSSTLKILRNQFVPFPIDKFMKIYKSNVVEKIALLEKEFENLQ